MTKVTRDEGESVSLKSKTFYKIAIWISAIFGIGHAGYTFIEYTALEEPALWFFSGALAILFNTGLNIIYATESSKRYFVITLLSNSILLTFSFVLAVVITEPQTIGFALAMLLTLIASIMRQYPSQIKLSNKKNTDETHCNDVPLL